MKHIYGEGGFNQPNLIPSRVNIESFSDTLDFHGLIVNLEERVLPICSNKTKHKRIDFLF